MNLRKTATNWVSIVVDKTLVRLTRHIYYKVAPPKTVLQVLSERASTSAADYVESHMPRTMGFSGKQQLMEFALSKVALKGMLAEFGVFQGESINHIAGRLKDGATIFGFDSFEGLKEDWSGYDLTKGTFSLGGQLPPVRVNVELITGWFDETLPRFLTQHPGNFAFIHVDCDTYEATRTLFKAAGERVAPGTVIVFDEYFGYPGWRVGEWKAWQEFVAERGVRYEYIGFSVNQVAVRIL